MSFQIHALSPAPFAPLFDMSDAELASHNAVRHRVTHCPDVPCRISLADAEVGETVILVNHVHQPASSPYQASHAIYVRQDVAQAMPAIGEVPLVLRRRLISVRMFDAHHMMIGAEVADGANLDAALNTAFEDAQVAYVHLHFAKPGCFAAHLTRAA